VVAEFEAEIYQKPPRKSAVTRRLRTRTIYDLDVLEVDDRQALLRIRCESGTYIRKLCHDIGLATGVGAHMGHLRRTATDPFDDRDLHPLQDLVDGLTWAEEGDDAFLREVVRPAEDALVHLPSVTIAPSARAMWPPARPSTPPASSTWTRCRKAGRETTGTTPIATPARRLPHPDGAAVCLGRLVGDPDAESGVVVSLERVLV